MVPWPPESRRRNRTGLTIRVADWCGSRTDERPGHKIAVTYAESELEPANPAVGLYLSEDWQVVKSGRDSDSMILELAS